MIAKLKDQLASKGRTISRLRSEGGSSVLEKAATFGGGAVLGKAESAAVVPPRLMGFDSALVIGGIGAFGVPFVLKGKVGKLADAFFLGPLAVAGYRVGQGQPMMAGSGPDGELAGGGWGPAE